MMIALDTEVTGIDLRHGAKPFFVTIQQDDGKQVYWEWDVDPCTREPEVLAADLDEIAELCSPNVSGAIVFQNPKFDVAALATLRPEFGEFWRWDATYDTLLAGHLLASNHRHDLTSMAVVYLGINIKKYETALKESVQECRRFVRTNHPDWRIAKEGLPEMPSAKAVSKSKQERGGEDGTPWRADYWLPRAVAKAQNLPPDHAYWTVLRDYSNADSAVTLALWQAQWSEIVRRKLDKIYECRRQVLPIVYEMESRGVTLSRRKLDRLREKYAEESTRAGDRCVSYAAGQGYELKLPKAGVNKSLVGYFEAHVTPDLAKCIAEAQGMKDTTGFDHGSGSSRAVLGGGFYTETGQLSINKNALKVYEEGLPARSRPLLFVKNLMRKRRRDTALTYLQSYERFWVPMADHPPMASRPTAESSNWASILSLPQETPASVLADQIAELEPSYVLRKTGRTGFTPEHVSRLVRDSVGPPRRDDWEWFRIHPALNPTGTDTLRFSSSNPNEQNISKQSEPCEECDGTGKDECKARCGKCGGAGSLSLSLRYCFGPAPGREWWSLDARGIEDRLPAYESQQEELIDIFERPDAPPYYGSNHFLRFSIVYPDIWDAVLKEVGLEKVGPTCKKRFAATWYQWVKNGGFAVQYGAVDREDGLGTADIAFHRAGSQALLRSRLAKLEGLNQHWIRYAKKYGYVETMPDRSVDPERGYPVLCSRTDRGHIKPTVPLNYHIQSTAMWWTMKAMIRIYAQLNDWRRTGFDGRIVMQVHDEIVLDFPRRASPADDFAREKAKQPGSAKFRTSNLWRIRAIQKLMEEGGKDVGVPTPVGCEYHDDNWSEGLSL